MVNYFFRYILIVGVINNSIAQNLIKNGDFEIKNKIFKSPLARVLLFQWYSDLCEVKYWDNPNRTSADIHQNGIYSSGLGVGKSKSFSGDYYLGLLFESDGTRNEYAETKLKTRLTKDSLYCIKFYTMADSRHGSYLKSIYISFIHKYYRQHDDNFFFIPDSIGFRKTDGSLIIDNDDYIELSNIYKSKGGETHIILGQFNEKEPFYFLGLPNEFHKVILHNRKYAYYFIDNISLKPIHDSSECSCHNNEKPRRYEETAQPEVNALQGKKYTFSSIKFNPKSAKLNFNSAGKDELDAIATILIKDSLIKVTVVSHVFETEIMSQNKKLSIDRAKALKDYFISQKLDSNRIEVLGAGSGFPLFDNDTKEHQAKNTRIELRFD